MLGLLGEGGMGEVYRARDPILKRGVAIKVLPSFVSQNPDRLRRFEQEAQAAATLNHPSILAVYQFGVFEGAPYLVSELLVGETLRQQLDRGPLPVRKAIDTGVQIAHGMAGAHEKGIVHRDLKPDLAAALRQQATGVDTATAASNERAEPRPRRESTRQGRVMVSGWLPMEARSSFKLIQAKHPEKLMQDLVAEAMNDLFAKYNVPQTAQGK